jgi:hypothetical protein
MLKHLLLLPVQGLSGCELATLRHDFDHLLQRSQSCNQGRSLAFDSRHQNSPVTGDIADGADGADEADEGRKGQW